MLLIISTLILVIRSTILICHVKHFWSFIVKSAIEILNIIIIIIIIIMQKSPQNTSKTSKGLFAFLFFTGRMRKNYKNSPVRVNPGKIEGLHDE